MGKAALLTIHDPINHRQKPLPSHEWDKRFDLLAAENMHVIHQPAPAQVAHHQLLGAAQPRNTPTNQRGGYLPE